MSYIKISIISYITRYNLGIQCNNTVHEVIINHPSMQNILLFDLTKKQCIKEVSTLFLVHLSEMNNKIAKFIILHLIQQIY